MKSIILSLFAITTISLAAQQDPEAKKILDRVNERTKGYLTIQAKFELEIENKQINKTSKSEGSIKIKGDRYYIESMGTQVYFDGQTLWSYLPEENEVTISVPDHNDDDFVENPAKIFSFYNRDFKYKLAGEAETTDGLMYEIDLFPRNLDQPYSRFKLFIRKSTEDVYMISASGKDGINYTAYLKEIRYNATIPDSQFVFEPAKHKNIEIIDMRF